MHKRTHKPNNLLFILDGMQAGALRDEDYRTL
jgi:hypothetical protein